MDTLFTTVQDRLKAQVPELLMIDWDMGQIDLPEEERPAVLFPCALLEINFPSCEDESDTIQQVEATVSVRLAFQVQEQTDSVVSTTERNAAMGYLGIVGKAYKALQGYETNEVSKFSRNSQTSDRRADGIKEVTITFSTTFEDLSADA